MMAAQWQKLQSLIQNRPGLTERELAKALYGNNSEQQRVNSDCRTLVLSKAVERRGLGGINDPYRYYPLGAVSLSESRKGVLTAPESQTAPLMQSAISASSATDDWFWEGNVVQSIAVFLNQNGWKIEATANTLSRERGIDVHATKLGLTLLVEAKGYPSTGYRDPMRAKERKPTNPTNQAQHWYSHALLKVMRLQTKHPDAIVAIGLPNFPRYRTLIDETGEGLRKLGIGLMMVEVSGEVAAFNIPGITPA